MREFEAQHQRLSREALQIQQKQLTDLAGVVAMATRQTVENLLKQINGPPLENALIESACQELKQSHAAGGEKMTVVSPSELDPTNRQKIATAAGMDSSIGEIDYRIDQELLGGIRIQTSRGVIDHSIVALSSFAEQNIRSQLNH